GPALAHAVGGSRASVVDEAGPSQVAPDELAAAEVIQAQWGRDSGLGGDVEVLQVDRRMRGPGVSVGDPGEAELTVMEWQRELQISGIGSEAYLLTRMPQPPFRLDQVYDARSGTSKILFLPGDQPEIQYGATRVETDGGLRLFGRRLP